MILTSYEKNRGEHPLETAPGCGEELSDAERVLALTCAVYAGEQFVNGERVTNLKEIERMAA
jgi:hypothetical protein